ncbi:MAG: PEP-CTERM sorting domain-containing protein [Gammaproteobacteria bacterium]
MRIGKKMVSAAFGFFMSGNVFANVSGTIALTVEDGSLVSRADESGVIVNTGNIYQAFFTTEKEWDERQIYNHVDVNGTPIDASDNLAYTSATNATPYLLGTDGSKNFSYNTDDFAWKEYPHAASLTVAPGLDGSADDQNISLHLQTDLKVWNGIAFVPTSGENVNVSTWAWTTTADDGVTDVYDGYKFPEGGWYAYLTDAASPDGADVNAGTYQFAPSDQYRWLFQLTPDADGNRDAGVYLLGLNFGTDAADVAASSTMYMLIAYGLGADLAESVKNPEYITAQNALAAVPVPSAFWLFGTALFGLVANRKRLP